MTESAEHAERPELPPVVEMVVRTRHPEAYRLVNEVDGTEWRFADGYWKRVPERAEGKRERDRATVVVAVREWAVESVMFTWEDADTVTRAQVASSFTTWLVMLDREAPPGSKALLREVLAEQVTAGGAGARFDRKRKVFVGLRLV